jgi:alpha-tubulin suppressor-like RCC1 family protein
MTGYNNYGQQGSGNTKDVTTFTKRLSNVRDVDAHTGSVTAAILENNDLYMCGYAQLWNQGNSTQTNYTSFHKVAENVKKVCAGTEYSFFIANDGLDTMYISGQLISYQNQYKGFTRYAAQINDIQEVDGSHLGYLTNDGKLYLGCRNNYGQCSTGSTSTTANVALRGGNVASMHLGQYVSWYIDNNGNLYGCGRGGDGQQGAGNQSNVLTFTKRAENVKEVHTDTSSTWYIDNNGDLYGCGGSYNLFPNTQSYVRTFTKVELPE